MYHPNGLHYLYDCVRCVDLEICELVGYQAPGSRRISTAIGTLKRTVGAKIGVSGASVD